MLLMKKIMFSKMENDVDNGTNNLSIVRSTKCCHSNVH
jgi:hypothetical protein